METGRLRFGNALCSPQQDWKSPADGEVATPDAAIDPRPEGPVRGAADVGTARPVATIACRGRSAVLDEIADLIGSGCAERLVTMFGGTRLYIPCMPEPGDELSVAIGHEAALKLARVYGSDRIELPNPPPRRTRIIELRASGASIDAIALALRCTRRRVFQVLAEARRFQRQRSARSAR
jgi:hypothetical protein